MYRSIFCCLLIFTIAACERKAPGSEGNNVTSPAAPLEIGEKLTNDVPKTGDSDNERKDAAKTAKAYKTIEWVELIPKKDLQALLNPPGYLDDVEDGSTEDKIESQFKSMLEVDEKDPYQQALVSTNTIPAMDGQLIRLPGFVVPLEFGDNEFEITQFFLVPFFGACLHYPPPPPNQIIYVNYPEGVRLTTLSDAFWTTGKLRTALTDNEMAKSAYAMELHSILPYYE